MTFTAAELDYFRSRTLGRLATVDADGAPQVNPVGFRVTAAGDIVIGGYAMARTRKFRNVAATGRAALVVDDLAARDPWTVRGIEVRGPAEATTAESAPIEGATTDVIVIHPETVFTWGVEATDQPMTRRSASD